MSDELGVSEFDLELELERDELANLLDRAMALLPPATRAVLVERYIRESPRAEIAAYLSLSETTVAKRLERGRLALRNVLVTTFANEAAEYGLSPSDDGGWQETRIWCPFCGRHRLAVRIDHEAGVISSSCTGPCFREGTIIGSKWMTAGTSALTSVKSILRRELIDLHEYYRQVLAARGGHCSSCGSPVALEHWSTNALPELETPYAYGIRLPCRACGFENDAPLSHLLLDTPLLQRFWRRHPRMEVLPVREIEVSGRAALLSGFASIDTGTRIAMIAAADTYEILHVDGSVER